MSNQLLQSVIGFGGLALQALFIAILFPALCLPLALRSRFESGGWGLWSTSLALAVVATLIYAAIIYLFSAIAGTSGSTQKVFDAASYMFFDMGGPLFLAAIYWGPALSLLIRATTGDHAKEGFAKIAVIVAMMAIPLLLAGFGAMMFAEALPKANT